MFDCWVIGQYRVGSNWVVFVQVDPNMGNNVWVGFGWSETNWRFYAFEMNFVSLVTDPTPIFFLAKLDFTWQPMHKYMVENATFSR